MPLVNAPIETYKELQYLLKVEESFLVEKDYLNATFKVVGESDKAFLTSLLVIVIMVKATILLVNKLFSQLKIVKAIRLLD